MKLLNVTKLFLLLLVTTAICANEAMATGDNASARDWHYNLAVVYSSRSLDGTLVNQTPIAKDAFGSLVATGDSMNVGTSDDFMFAAGAHYKRWGIALNYMPTSFTGRGSALAEVGGSGSGVIVKTPLNTNIDVNLLLANVTYDFIKTESSVFGIGAGLGRSSIDIAIIPDLGEPIIYSGDQPFGFLNIHMASNYKKFHYGFAMNSVSATFDGVDVDYSQYTVDLGYRVLSNTVKLDIVGGYRLVNFAMNIENNQNIVKTSIALEGPFLGINLAY